MTAEPGRAGTRLIVMMVSRRLTMVLAATAVPVALTVGCAGVTGARPAAAVEARAAPTARFSAMGLSFRSPAAWRSVTPRAGLSDFPGLIVYLSTSRLSGACVASASPGRIAETCAYPIRVLPSGGVLVRWNANRLPNWRMPKATTTVAGRGAVESRDPRRLVRGPGRDRDDHRDDPARRARQVVSDGRLPARPGPAPAGSADIVHAQLGTHQPRLLRPVSGDGRPRHHEPGGIAYDVLRIGA